MNLWDGVDFSYSLKPYEYTRYAKYQIYRTIESDDFKHMDSQAIFTFISDKMEIVFFHEYLKRFIYQKCRIKEPIENVSQKDFISILYNAFVENAAPHSFEETKARLRNTLAKWLSAEAVKRNTIFCLGFGLNMSDQEVEEFLTKINKEESFDFGNPQEAVFWFCYHNKKRFSKAKELLAYYESLEVSEYKNKSLWDAMKHDPKMYIHSEEELLVYLKYLKTFLETEDASHEEFISLYKRVQELILNIFRETEDAEYSLEDIGPGTIEKVFYAEVPLTGKNLKKMSASLLSKQFRNRRMGKAHISQVLNKKIKPDRFDIITLLFFLYAHNVYYEETEEDKLARFRDYMDEVNEILTRCNMAGIYPVNPYEAFILLCLVADDPLNSYYDVWGLSYGKEVI